MGAFLGGTGAAFVVRGRRPWGGGHRAPTVAESSPTTSCQPAVSTHRRGGLPSSPPPHALGPAGLPPAPSAGQRGLLAGRSRSPRPAAGLQTTAAASGHGQVGEAAGPGPCCSRGGLCQRRHPAPADTSSPGWAGPGRGLPLLQAGPGPPPALPGARPGPRPGARGAPGRGQPVPAPSRGRPPLPAPGGSPRPAPTCRLLAAPRLAGRGPRVREAVGERGAGAAGPRLRPDPGPLCPQLPVQPLGWRRRQHQGARPVAREGTRGRPWGAGGAGGRATAARRARPLCGAPGKPLLRCWQPSGQGALPTLELAPHGAHE